MKPVAFDNCTPVEVMLEHRRAWRLDSSHYEVIARDGGHRYEVTLQPSGDLRCTCTAATYGRPCWHEQKVAARLLREGPPEDLLSEDPADGAGVNEVWGRL